MGFEVPVLLLTWRRPDTTRQLIDALRPVAPQTLYVASDGPRDEAEAAQVQATRELIAREVDWACTLKTRYSDHNQGCQLGVSSAISWFFDQEEEGIVLEDDCVPHPDFFPYCQTLLERYRFDTRIWCISGDNFQDGQWRGEASYYFSRYNHCWGWASWRRCWRHYAQHPEIWRAVCASSSMQRAMFEDPLERRYWLEIWIKLFDQGVPDSWAYRWSLVCMANSGLTALPNRNLVTNIGFGEGATHTLGQGIAVASRRLSIDCGPLVVCRDLEADMYSFQGHFGGIDYQNSLSPLWCLSRRLALACKNPFHYPVKILRLIFHQR